MGRLLFLLVVATAVVWAVSWLLERLTVSWLVVAVLVAAGLAGRHLRRHGEPR